MLRATVIWLSPSACTGPGHPCQMMLDVGARRDYHNLSAGGAATRAGNFDSRQAPGRSFARFAESPATGCVESFAGPARGRAPTFGGSTRAGALVEFAAGRQRRGVGGMALLARPMASQKPACACPVAAGRRLTGGEPGAGDAGWTATPSWPALARILSDLRWDAVEDLSRVVGDVVLLAPSAGCAARWGEGRGGLATGQRTPNTWKEETPGKRAPGGRLAWPGGRPARRRGARRQTAGATGICWSRLPAPTVRVMRPLLWRGVSCRCAKRCPVRETRDALRPAWRTPTQQSVSSEVADTVSAAPQRQEALVGATLRWLASPPCRHIEHLGALPQPTLPAVCRLEPVIMRFSSFHHHFSHLATVTAWTIFFVNHLRLRVIHLFLRYCPCCRAMCPNCCRAGWLALKAWGRFLSPGQVLSTCRDLLPPEYADELALLQDRWRRLAARRAR